MNKILIVILTFSLLACKSEKKKDTVTKQDIEVHTENLTSKLDSIKSELENYKTRFKALEFLSTGEFKYTENEESDIYGENYRVEIYLSEIYKSVYVSHIEYYGEGMQRISLRTKLDFEKMTGITSEQTNGLEFKKWNNFKHFELKLGEQIYGIEINKPNEFTISEY